MKPYFWNIFVALDQLLNTVFGGDPDETISSRSAKSEHWFGKGLCRALHVFDKGHCQKYIEVDEGPKR